MKKIFLVTIGKQGLAYFVNWQLKRAYETDGANRVTGTREPGKVTHLISLRAARNLGPEIVADRNSRKHRQKNIMKFLIAITALSICVTTANAASNRQGSSGDHLRGCTARVLYSEELPFAPVGKWLVNVTLEITPPNGIAYPMTLHEWMPWQGPPPRRGQAFRLLCDPANPGDLHLPPPV